MPNPRVTYKQGFTSKDLGEYFGAITIPIILFMFALVVISSFGAFGRKILAPATSLMWIAGAATAWKIPSQRGGTLKETYIAVAGYLATITLLKFLIGVFATTSSEQLMASYNQAMPVSTGSTVTGFLQSMLWILSATVPIGYLGMTCKKFVTFRRTMSKDKVLQQVRGIRERRR